MRRDIQEISRATDAQAKENRRGRDDGREAQPPLTQVALRIRPGCRGERHQPAETNPTPEMRLPDHRLDAEAAQSTPTAKGKAAALQEMFHQTEASGTHGCAGREQHQERHRQSCGSVSKHFVVGDHHPQGHQHSIDTSSGEEAPMIVGLPTGRHREDCHPQRPGTGLQSTAQHQAEQGKTITKADTGWINQNRSTVCMIISPSRCCEGRIQRSTCKVIGEVRQCFESNAKNHVQTLALAVPSRKEPLDLLRL